METKEKIAILNELINRFGLSANPHENDYLFNVLRAIKDDYIEKEKEEIKGISEDLNTASSEYEAKSYQLKLTKDGEFVKSINPAIKIAFIAGANWRKEQMMKYGTEYQVAEGSMCPAMESIPVLANTDMILLPKDKFKVGDKIKVIIIKED